jgi:hypothetical protein
MIGDAPWWVWVMVLAIVGATVWLWVDELRRK